MSIFHGDVGTQLAPGRGESPRARVTMTRMGARSSMVVTLMFPLAVVGCERTNPDPDHSAPHYVVTRSPIEVGVGSGICVAVDPDDPGGVWWWQPGNDCSKRTTGPGVFPGEQAVITRGPEPATTDIRFRVQVHRAPGASEPPYVDVRLTLKNGRLGTPGTNNSVETITRRDLEIPEMWR